MVIPGVPNSLSPPSPFSLCSDPDPVPQSLHGVYTDFSAIQARVDTLLDHVPALSKSCTGFIEVCLVVRVKRIAFFFGGGLGR